ncbi:MAG: chromate transporter [Oscillospiraceae bacterium]
MYTLFITFFSIGLFTFGGGYAMIPFIIDIVNKKNWLDFSTLVDFIAISESTPGVFAVNISTFIGYNLFGFIGSFLATLGVVLPSFIIVILISKNLDRLYKNIYFKNIIKNLKALVTGLIFSSFLSIFIGNIFYDEKINYIFFLILFIIIIVNKIKKLNPILIIIISSFLGLLLYSLIKI